MREQEASDGGDTGRDTRDRLVASDSLVDVSFVLRYIVSQLPLLEAENATPTPADGTLKPTRPDSDVSEPTSLLPALGTNQSTRADRGPQMSLS